MSALSHPPDQPLLLLSFSQEKTLTVDRDSKREGNPKSHRTILGRWSRHCRPKQKQHCNFHFFCPSNIFIHKKAWDLPTPSSSTDGPSGSDVSFSESFSGSFSGPLLHKGPPILGPDPELVHVKAMSINTSWRFAPPRLAVSFVAPVLGWNFPKHLFGTYM